MPTFCRHNRFLERCPICSKTLPGEGSSAGQPRRTQTARRAGPGQAGRRRSPRDERVRVHRELRADDDGYRSTLVPGLRASADALHLAEEIGFSTGRLITLRGEPPGLYGEVRALATEDLERATWACFLIAYLSPLEVGDGEDPFAGIRLALAAAPSLDGGSGAGPSDATVLPELGEIPLGPRTSHDPARGAETLLAYRQWVGRAPRGGSQAQAFVGDPSWGSQRRFERLFERLALPGFGRMGRYDLLLTLGCLGLYELRPDSLHFAGARGLSADDPTTLAAKRVFGIGDPLLLERRAASLAQAAGVPLEALDLALSNWASPQRATLGVPKAMSDPAALEGAGDALGL
jgi:Alpha-glutamyl/putrescinyl thymine pyrophosphorylase clade 3